MGVRNIYTAQITLVGAAQIEGTVIVPSRGLIWRVNMFNSAGTAVSQIRGAIGRVTGFTGNDVLAKYSLSPLTVPASATNDVVLGLLSSAEPGLFYSVTPTIAGWTQLFWSAAVDDATLDHTVDLELTIEDLYNEHS